MIDSWNFFRKTNSVAYLNPSLKFNTAMRGRKMKRMKKCGICKIYTLDESHCGQATHSPHPPKFSIEDKYATYRRMNKEIGN